MQEEVIYSMRFEGIDFPSPIIQAQENGELVIFAGAGVSMPSPSDLPSFTKLANELADGTAVLRKDEAIDRFLGRLPSHLNIYERTRARLQVATSKPNLLHFDLLKIFARSAAIRLVTTNFDDHFANAAFDLFKTDLPEMFFAPALPVGGNFSGIVHLHGSLQKKLAGWSLRIVTLAVLTSPRVGLAGSSRTYFSDTPSYSSATATKIQ
jgi:NAD-dependent SIR2 family protein deacetylase